MNEYTSEYNISQWKVYIKLIIFYAIKILLFQDCLYHHPVHKISFIAQDMSDSRAFGYIFGSPDTGHRFFGIKTDKAASQVSFAQCRVHLISYWLQINFIILPLFTDILIFISQSLL